jgi:hypothetical protein
MIDEGYSFCRLEMTMAVTTTKIMDEFQRLRPQAVEKPV